MAGQYLDPYEEWKSLGRPGGSFQAWQSGQQAAPVTPAGPPAGSGQFNQAWMDQGLAAYAAGQRGSDPTMTPGFDPATFRQTYAGMAGGNRPEDLARFSDATLAGWMPFYDPQTGKYRSMRGAEGWYDKPTECPPGQMPSGPDETDPCIPNPGTAAPAPAAAPAQAPTGQMPNLAATLAPFQAQTAGVQGGSVSQPVNLAQTLQPFQSSTQAFLSPTRPANIQAAPVGAPGVQGGWTSTSGFRPPGSPLEDMMARNQRRQGGPVRWF